MSQLSQIKVKFCRSDISRWNTVYLSVKVALPFLFLSYSTLSLFSSLLELWLSSFSSTKDAICIPVVFGFMTLSRLTDLIKFSNEDRQMYVKRNWRNITMLYRAVFLRACVIILDDFSMNQFSKRSLTLDTWWSNHAVLGWCQKCNLFAKSPAH